jgi:murein DD-endopeptidase MepM/ murein hydrolase activator NlpD
MMRTAAIWLLIILLALPPFAFGQHKSTRHRQRRQGHSASQLKKDLQAVRSQKELLRKNLEQTKQQTHAVLSDIYKVDAQIDDIEDKLESTNTRLGDSQDEQKHLVVELKDATQRLDAMREQVRKRLRHIYVHGNTSSISAMVGTKSVGDIASRRFLLQMIAKRDRQLFSDYQKLRDLVAHRKRRQDQLVVRISGLVEEQAHQREELKGSREMKTHVLKNLRSKQGELQAMLRQFESDEREISAQIAAFARRRLRPGEKPMPAFHGHFERPVPGAVVSGFGMRYHPVLHITRLHAGVDFHAEVGTPIHAGADGEVISARYSTSFGNVVYIYHGGGISTVYAHCSRLLVSTGQRVRRGEVIALSGATGLVAGPHLHFEVHVNDHAVNPIGWF